MHGQVLGYGHLDQRDLEREGGLGALVLIHTVMMQAVPASAGGRIVKRQTEIITSEKPFEGALRLTPPSWIARDTEGLQTRGNHRLGLHRLLVEIRALAILLMEAIAADRPEMPGRGLLLRGQPAQAFKTDFKRR